MDASQYDPQAVANAEAQIQLEQDRGATRRDAVALIMRALAQVIADDVVIGADQWPSRVERYRYLRDLPWDGGQPPAVGEGQPFHMEPVPAGELDDWGRPAS